MAVIADRCPENQVAVVDLNQARIDACNDADLSRLLVYEPGLDAVVERARGRNFHISTAVEEQIAQAGMVFISVNTPTKTKGLGAGQASDLRWVDACARTVAQAATGHTIVVDKSTLPVRTAPAIRICGDLLEEGAQLAIHAPKVEPAQMARDLHQDAAAAADALSGKVSWVLAGSVEEAVAGADAVLILTEWRQYRAELAGAAGGMRRLAWVFDSRAVTDP